MPDLFFLDSRHPSRVSISSSERNYDEQRRTMTSHPDTVVLLPDSPVEVPTVDDLAVDITAADVTGADNCALHSPAPSSFSAGRDLLGLAALSDTGLSAVVTAALDHPAEVTEWSVAVIPTAITAISTEAVLKVQGIATAGRDQLPWAVLVKILRSPRHWPGITEVPEPVRQNFIDNLPWRVEADTLTSDLPGMLPPGLRTPQLFLVDDLGDDRIALWTEFIDVSQAPWDLTRFRTAANLLGRLAGRRIAEAEAWTKVDRTRLGLRQLA